jgi:hypothetical protein
MFLPDPDQWRMGFLHTTLPPHFLGGVAPSRHDLALAGYMEEKTAHREATSETQPGTNEAMRLWRFVYRQAHRLAGAVCHPQHGHFRISRLTNEMK